ncbi:hypothetical protein DFH05DRAFT_1518264 [Lentinula detonsa]|uniref:Uncharacterized protein n=1 Tax=Lentinula detonsa TaxID=2804962 RepID=A0A9W8PA32_9AGAR|nr:hypothetical protein DFH05DRAFT_1518264 [Lentinula detonsa]
MTAHSTPLILMTSSSIKTEVRERCPEKLEIISKLKKFSLEKNYQIECENDRRKERTLFYLEKKAPEMGSPSASLTTITEEGYNNTRKIPTLLKRVRKWIPGPVLVWMVKAKESSAKGKRPRNMEEDLCTQTTISFSFAFFFVQDV